MSTMLFSMHETDGVIKIDNYESDLSIFITPFSITHFMFGYMTQYLGINYFYGLILHTIYEYINYVSSRLKKNWSEEWKGFKSDSIFNSIGDTLLFLLGMMLAKNYNNIYLFIFIFLIGIIFYSPYFQNYLTNLRLEYLKNKDYNFKIKNTLFVPHNQVYTYNIWFIIWTITSSIAFIKLKIINKKYK